MNYFYKRPAEPILKLYYNMLSQHKLIDAGRSKNDIRKEALLYWHVVLAAKYKLRKRPRVITPELETAHKDKDLWDSLSILKDNNRPQGTVLPALDHKEWEAAIARLIASVQGFKKERQDTVSTI